MAVVVSNELGGESVCHGVGNDVDSERIGFLHRELLEIPGGLRLRVPSHHLNRCCGK